jgi:AraC family transcriptional regulator
VLGRRRASAARSAGHNRKRGKDARARADYARRIVNDTLERIGRALDVVETRLFDERLAPADLARAAAFSPWHFHRVFLALTGETPAGYVRRRRFAEICHRLCETPDAIATLALDCGFGSQATFTRAFTREIGVSPGRYRAAGSVAPAHRFGPLDLNELVARARRESMEPRIAHRSAFNVVGMAERFTPATTSRIPELWTRFVARMDAIPHRHGVETYGVCADADPPSSDEPGFTYVAGVAVERLSAIPDGMIALTIPAGRYAVFTHEGHISRLGDTVKQIWGRWLPASPYRHVPRPDFEQYDARWDPQTGLGEIDVWVPIADE